MKKLTRWMSALLALVLALGCCQLTVAEGTELEAVDLIYWCGCNPNQKDQEMVLAECKRLAKEALNVDLQMVIVETSEIKEKFNKAMAAQERVDLTWTGYVQPIANLVNLGALMPLDDLLAQYGQDLTASIDEDLLNAHRHTDGHLYQFPAWQGMVGNRHYQMFAKSKVDATVGAQWVDELQALMYENWDKEDVEAKRAVYAKVEEYLASLKEKDMLGLGYCVFKNALASWYDNHSIENLGTWGGYVELWDDTFTVKSWAERPWAREYARIMADWYDKGYIREDAASVDAGAVDDKVGFTDPVSDDCYVMMGHNGFSDALSNEISNVAREVYTVHTNPYCWTTLGTATGTSIPYTCAQPERAMMFMNWLVTDDEKAVEFYNTYSYGIEGTHYEWNEDHSQITVFGGDWQATGDWDYGQRPWMLGTMKNAYSCAAYPANYYKDLTDLQNSAKTSPLLGFSFDPIDVETECSMLDTIQTEYNDMLKWGYLGADAIDAKYDEYIDKMKAAGLDEVTAASQAQVNAFIAENGRSWN